MSEEFSRMELLIGRKGAERLKNARVAVFGIGGVGGYTVEALARCGVGELDLIDADRVCLSNLNRQIIALRSTVGRYKADVAKERVLDINPDATVNVHKIFYLPDTAGQFDFAAYDYVVDAIDTVTGKIGLIMQAQAEGTPVISSMGAGNKMDAAAFEVADIYETSVCPLAKVMRRELKKRGVKSLKVVYSREKPVRPDLARTREISEEPDLAQEARESSDAAPMAASRRQTPGSIAFVPPVVGLIIAGEVVKDLAGCSWKDNE